jgi:hypothetical protein
MCRNLALCLTLRSNAGDRKSPMAQQREYPAQLIQGGTWILPQLAGNWRCERLELWETF